MAEIKFDLGPWYLGPDWGIRVGSHSGRLVASVLVPSDDDADRSEASANGCLMAAAPEMYVALVSAQAALNPMSGIVKKPRSGGPGDRALEATRNDIRRALRKAQFGAP